MFPVGDGPAGALGAHATLQRHLVGQLAEQEGVVGGIHRAAIASGDLDLTWMELTVVTVDGDAGATTALVDLQRQPGRIASGPGCVDTMRRQRQRAATYRQWRRDYAALDAADYPASVATAALLNRGDADSRFADALDRMLDRIAP